MKPLYGSFAPVLLIIVLFAGCSSAPTVRQFNDLDLSEKSITCPIGGDRLIGLLKESLYKDGWEITASAYEYTITKKNDSEEITYDKYKTAFILYVSYRPFTFWSIDDTVLSFDISLIDIRTKQEVLTYSGQASIFSPYSYEKVVDGFLEKLHK